MNKVHIIGRLGQEPSMRYTPNGKAVTSFSVASSRKFNNQEETTWFNCSAWGNLAEICNEYLQNGQQVYVEGRVSLRTYERRDGGTGASLEVNVTDIQFLGQKQQASEPQGDFEDDINDLPF